MVAIVSRPQCVNCFPMSRLYLRHFINYCNGRGGCLETKGFIIIILRKCNSQSYLYTLRIFGQNLYLSFCIVMITQTISTDILKVVSHPQIIFKLLLAMADVN